MCKRHSSVKKNPHLRDSLVESHYSEKKFIRIEVTDLNREYFITDCCNSLLLSLPSASLAIAGENVSEINVVLPPHQINIIKL